MDHFYEGVVVRVEEEEDEDIPGLAGRGGQAEADEGQLLSVDPLTTLLNDNLP